MSNQRGGGGNANNSANINWRIIGGLFCSAMSISSGLYAFRLQRQKQALEQAPSPQSTSELTDLLNNAKNGRVHIKLRGALKTDKPYNVKTDHDEQIESCVQRVVVFRESVTLALSSKQEVKQDFVFCDPKFYGPGGISINIPEAAPFPYDTVAHERKQICHPLISAITGLIHLSVPFAHHTQTDIVRNGQEVTLIGDVVQDKMSGSLVFMRPRFNFFSPRPYELTRSTETELRDSLERRIISSQAACGLFSLAALGFFGKILFTRE